jgi:hypothetical protein
MNRGLSLLTAATLCFGLASESRADIIPSSSSTPIRYELVEIEPVAGLLSFYTTMGSNMFTFTDDYREFVAYDRDTQQITSFGEGSYNGDYYSHMFSQNGRSAVVPIQNLSTGLDGYKVFRDGQIITSNETQEALPFGINERGDVALAIRRDGGFLRPAIDTVDNGIQYPLPLSSNIQGLATSINNNGEALLSLSTSPAAGWEHLGNFLWSEAEGLRPFPGIPAELIDSVDLYILNDQGVAIGYSGVIATGAELLHAKDLLPLVNGVSNIHLSAINNRNEIVGSYRPAGQIFEQAILIRNGAGYLLRDLVNSNDPTLEIRYADRVFDNGVISVGGTRGNSAFQAFLVPQQNCRRGSCAGPSGLQVLN